MKGMETDLSYHDVVVYCGNIRYKISDNYALQLHCTRVAGWQLWKIWNGNEVQLGGEFHGEPFCVEVAGMIIVGKKPETIEQPRPFGWNGIVVNEGGTVTICFTN